MMQRVNSNRLKIISQKREPDKSILESNLHGSNGKIHSFHFEKKQGVIEKGFGYEDEVSAGNFSEIMMDGINIFYTEQQATKERIINVDFNFPVIQMLFLFKREDIDRLNEAKLFIEKNMLAEFSLPELSHMVGINEFELKKGFKELFGTTAINYLNELKMGYVKRLLLDEKKNVFEVAMELGYSEPHHFSAAFKRRFGYTPKEIKK